MCHYSPEGQKETHSWTEAEGISELVQLVSYSVFNTRWRLLYLEKVVPLKMFPFPPPLHLCIFTQFCELRMRTLWFNKMFTFFEKWQVTIRVSWEIPSDSVKDAQTQVFHNATVVKIAHCWELLHGKCHVFYREIPLFTTEHERSCQNDRRKDEMRGILQSCVAPIKELSKKVQNSGG